MSDLRVSATLALPLDFVTARVSLVGMSGAGKSNAFADMIEEVVKARGLFVLVDPLGAAWGMRSNAAGDGPGLPVPIFGGYHADVSITPNSGEIVARELYHADANGIVDLSAFGPREAALFFAAMTNEFLALHRRQKKPRAYFVDEAALLMPERQSSDAETASLDAGWRIHTGGRALGLGLKTATQSAAEQAKRTMKQSELFVAMRTFAPIDQKPILDYLRTSVDAERSNEIKRTLAKLQDGEAWFIAPHWLGLVERARFRLRETFDSARTPKVGEVIAEPKVLADVDLARISDAIAAATVTVDDVRGLPADGKTIAVSVDRVVERSILTDNDRYLLRKVIGTLGIFGAAIDLAREQFDHAKDALESMDELVERINHGTAPGEPAQGAEPRRSAAAASPANETTQGEIGGGHSTGRKIATLPGVPPTSDLASGPRGLLEVLVKRHPMKMTRQMLSTLSGRSIRSSSFGPHIRELVERGFVVDNGGGMTATAAGIAAIGGKPARAETPAEILAMWTSKLPPGSARMLTALAAAYPKSIQRCDIAEASGMSPTSSGVGAAITVLRNNGLIQVWNDAGLRATDALFPGKAR